MSLLLLFQPNLSGAASGSKTQPAIARIQKSVSNTQSGTGRIRPTNILNQMETWVDIMTQDYGVNNSTYAEVNNTTFPRYYQHRYLFDISRWDNITAIYFESQLSVTGTGTVKAKLYNVTDAVDIAGSEVSASAVINGVQRSGNLLSAMPSSAKQLAVWVSSTTSGSGGNNGFIASGRLVIQQGATATKFEQDFSINQASHVNGTTTPYVDIGSGLWLYEASRFDGIQYVTFEVSGAVQGSGTVGTYDLWDFTSSSVVTTLTISSVSSTTLATSADIKSSLIDGHMYGVRLTCSVNSGTASMSQGGARLRIGQAYATKTQLIMNGVFAGLFADTDNDGVQLDPTAYGSNFSKTMYAEIVYVNNSASGAGRGYAKDGNATEITNSSVTAPAGDTAIHRVRNSSAMPWPTSSTFYRPFNTTTTSPGTVINVWRGVINMVAQAVKTQPGNANILVPKYYTRQQFTTLPTSNADLSTVYTATEITTVSTSGNTTDVNQFVSQTYAMHQFDYQVANNTNPITPIWIGHSTEAGTSSPIVMQIYNFATPGWETIASNSTVAAGTSLTLSGTKNTNISNYMTSNLIVYVRVYQ